MIAKTPRISPFEEDEHFAIVLEKTVREILKLLLEGRKRHGDAFAESGLKGLAEHCWRKARDQRRLVVDGEESSHSQEVIAEDQAVYSVLNLTYIRLAKEKGIW